MMGAMAGAMNHSGAMAQRDVRRTNRVDSSPLAADWPLAGRSQILRQIRETLIGSRGRGVVLAGETGVGKSRLAQEVLRLAEAADVATARVTGKLASSGIPLGAFAPLLPSIGHDETGVVDDRADLLRRCADALKRRAGGRQLVLYVDDAHLLDDVSATLVFQLADTASALVMATVRSRELAPDPIVALWKDGLADRVEVEGLDPDSVSEALTGALGGAVDDAAVASLARRAKGNMLFLRELVLGAIEEGALSNEGGIWRLSGELHPTARLVELVEARLTGLSDAERAMMELVSFGEPLGSDELGALGDLAIAETLERKGLLHSWIDHQRVSVVLAHPLYGEVIRSQTPAIRTRAIVRSLADAVESAGIEAPADLIRVASWRLTSGVAAPDLMLKAATAARWRFDFQLAERLAESAVAAGAGFEAELLLAQLAGLQGRSEEGASALAALADQATDTRQKGLIALSRLDNRVIYAGTIDEGLQIAEEAEASLAGTPMADEIAARRAALLVAREGPGKAAEVATPLLARATGRALVWACMPAAYSLARAGRAHEALDAARRGWKAQLALTAPMDWYPWMHHFYEAEALAHSGRFVEAEEVATAEYTEALRDGSVEAQALFDWQLAKTVADRGHVDEAVRRAQLAVAIYRELDRPQFVQFCLIYQVLALALGRRHKEALEALQLHDSLALDGNYWMGVDLLHARAWVEIAGGNPRQAFVLLTEAADVGERIGDLAGATACLHTAARIGHAKDVVSRLEELTQHMQGGLAPGRAAHARALANDRPDELETVAETFEAMGATLLAAEAASDAAVAWRRHGEVRRSAVAERRAAWLASQCKGAVTPALQVAETRARLTSAEWEAVQLASAGRSNKQIADELIISVRTVENRLQHAYGKLGVSGRSELAAALQTVQGPSD
jgi:DNA-binding CsgD family transcriptional regulator